MDVPVRVLALVWMIGEVGTKEIPANSNSGPRVRFYQAACALARTIPTGWAWCKALVQCAFREIGHPLAYTTASCGEFRRWARGLGWERPAAAAGWPGDVVEFDWDKLDGPGQGDWPDHTGMVVSRRGHRPPRIVLDALQKKLGLESTSAVLSWLETMHRSWEYVCVEGNTSLSNDSNGGQVMLRGRELRQIEAFITVPGVTTIEGQDTAPPPPLFDVVVGTGKNAKVVGRGWRWTRVKRWVKQRPRNLKRIVIRPSAGAGK